MKTVLSIKELTLSYKPGSLANALENVSFLLNRGESLAILGPNGAGKSSLLRCISSTLIPSSGSIVNKFSSRYVSHASLPIIGDISVFESTRLWLAWVNKSLPQVTEIQDCIRLASLHTAEQLPIQTLSQGQTQQLMCSVLFANLPPLLLIDEWFQALDANSETYYCEIIDSYLKNQGTIVWASHRLDLLKRFCKRGIVLHAGRVVSDSRIDEALERYRSISRLIKEAKSVESL